MSLRLDQNTTEGDVAHHFQAFDEALRGKSNRAWGWLEQHLKPKFQSWVYKTLGRQYAKYAYDHQTIKEEVHALTMLEMVAKYDKFSFESFEKLKSLYFRIGNLKLKEYMRRNYTGKIIESDSLEPHQRDAQMFSKIVREDEERALKAEQSRVFEEMLLSLSDQDQTLIKMFMEDADYQKIARTLNITPTAARQRKSRILKQLKEIAAKLLSLVLLLI